MRKKKKYRPVYKRNYKLKNGKEKKEIWNTYSYNNCEAGKEEKEEEEEK